MRRGGDAEVAQALEAINAARRRGEVHDSHREFERRSGAGRRLAVYGSLAPGKENHHVLSGLSGHWWHGYVRGTLYQEGWGAGMGYPALRLDPGAARIDVQVFESDELPGHWPSIDAFEGSEYCRVLALVASDDARAAVANLYAMR